MGREFLKLQSFSQVLSVIQKLPASVLQKNQWRQAFFRALVSLKYKLHFFVWREYFRKKDFTKLFDIKWTLSGIF